MKLNRGVLIIVLLLVLIVIVVQAVLTRNSKDPEPSRTEVVIVSPPGEEDEQNAVAAYNSVKTRVSQDTEEGSDPNYSPYFAGGYIDEDNSLTIMLTEDREEIRAFYLEISGSVDIEFVTAKYPYTQLQEVMETCNYCTQEAAMETGFIVAGIDELNNRVVVGLQEVTNEKITMFKEKIADSDCLVFEEYPAIAID